jgi:hypothetical protein
MAIVNLANDNSGEDLSADRGVLFLVCLEIAGGELAAALDLSRNLELAITSPRPLLEVEAPHRRSAAQVS